jgi:hypothetical protein
MNLLSVLRNPLDKVSKQGLSLPGKYNTEQLIKVYLVYPRGRMRPCLLINSKRKTFIGHKYCGSYASVIHSCVVHSSLKILFIYSSLRKLRVLSEFISSWANKPMHVFRQTSRVRSLRFQQKLGGVYNPPHIIFNQTVFNGFSVSLAAQTDGQKRRNH